MNKLLFALVAVVFAGAGVSAMAADSATTTTEAPAATTSAPAAASTTSKPVKKHGHTHKTSSNDAKLNACKEEAKAKNLSRADRKAYVNQCMSKTETPPATSTKK